ncbi:HutD family protein [Gordonia sp. CPCC 206044]|uniref:HutD/Ves family protein n=1 Tax=Gordonia sp. CPCC 206044 TaxID=3140793 RepID=UPI003AF3E248
MAPAGTAASAPPTRQTHQIRTAAALSPTRWRNGAGTTRRIAAGGTPSPEPDWTLSLADIDTDCCFSAFPDVDRMAVVVGDNPVDLTIGGQRRTLALLDRVTFAGEDTVHAHPTRGATQLLNLMTRRRTLRGALTLRHHRGAAMAGTTDGVAWVVLAGTLHVDDVPLRRWDTVLLGNTPVEITGAATVAAVHVTPWGEGPTPERTVP